jgi:cell division protein FtsB
MASQATRAPARYRSPQRKGPIRWDRVGRVALLAVLGIILVLYISPTKHWIEQSGTASAQREELGRLKAEQRRLQSQVRDLRGPAALEREARRLGMVKQGERPYVIEGLPKD